MNTCVSRPKPNGRGGRVFRDNLVDRGKQKQRRCLGLTIFLSCLLEMLSSFHRRGQRRVSAAPSASTIKMTGAHLRKIRAGGKRKIPLVKYRKARRTTPTEKQVRLRLQENKTPRKIPRAAMRQFALQRIFRTGQFPLPDIQERETGLEPATICLEGRHSTS